MIEKPIVVAALGSPMASDDAVGLHLLKKMDTFSGNIEKKFWADVDGLTLAQELMDLEHRAVFLIDCADMGIPPGETRTFNQNALKLSSSSVSTHGFGVQEALQLVSALGCSIDARIYGVQPFDCSPSTRMTSEMEARFPAILLACRKSIEAFILEKTCA
ncbi:MAG: hypothetical protein CSA81_06280 [Acidobacteria bacterium]|nr:MAG: hypothetical protein CSA81_06280 [Acidobacteriota bacterium]